MVIALGMPALVPNVVSVGAVGWVTCSVIG